MAQSAASHGAGFLALCLLFLQHASSDVASHSASPAPVARAGKAAFAPLAVPGSRVSWPKSIVPLCLHRAVSTRLRAASVSMGLGGKRKDVAPRSMLQASGSQQPSETLYKALDEDGDFEESMSMMASTDVYRKEDKVRVFGAVSSIPASCNISPR